MSALALALILAAAFAHASWNLLSKKAGGGGGFVWIYSLVSTALYAPITLAALLWQPRHLGLFGLTFVIGSAVIHTGYFVLLQYSYRIGDLSLVYPLARGTGCLISTISAILLFGERPSALALTGAFVIGGSIVLLASSSSSDKTRRDFLSSIVTGALIAMYTLWDKHAVSHLGVSPLLMEWGSTSGLTLLLLPTALGNWEQVCHEWTVHRKHAIGIGILCPLAYILVLTALSFSPVSYVAPAREMSILIGRVMGARLLAEGHPRQRLAAAGFMVLGMIALAAG
jgi:drug/metabolite transporter (DMT)-like permease